MGDEGAGSAVQKWASMRHAPIMTKHHYDRLIINTINNYKMHMNNNATSPAI